MIIGIAGYAQTGKDTAAKALVGFTRYAFADILKDEVNDMLYAVGVSDNTHNDEQKKFWRDFLVFWGAKRRKMQADYWISELNKALIISRHRIKNVVITDVRYLNEVNWILDQGGKIIRLHRPGVSAANEEERLSFMIIDQAVLHSVTNIDNDGAIEDLHDKIKSLDFLKPPKI